MVEKKKTQPEAAVDPTLKQSEIDPIIGEAVGSQLKSLFDGLENEAVPDRFLELISQLEENETSKSKRAKGEDEK